MQNIMGLCSCTKSYSFLMTIELHWYLVDPVPVSNGSFCTYCECPRWWSPCFARESWRQEWLLRVVTPTSNQSGQTRKMWLKCDWYTFLVPFASLAIWSECRRFEHSPPISGVLLKYWPTIEWQNGRPRFDFATKKGESETDAKLSDPIAGRNTRDHKLVILWITFADATRPCTFRSMCHRRRDGITTTSQCLHCFLASLFWMSGFILDLKFSHLDVFP